VIDARRNVVTLQTHNRVKRQLAQLLKKHEQFQVILNRNHPKQSSSPSIEFDVSGQFSSLTVSTFLPFSQDEYDLNAMLTRLDRLSSEQDHQWNDFIPGRAMLISLSSPLPSVFSVKEPSDVLSKGISSFSSRDK
jgi:uncharacterized protein YqcC (DUF446 family)